MSNIGLAREVLRACARAGVGELVVCAGARNAPLVALLAKCQGVRTYSFFEERSAGFFALGRILSTGRPVAVITTSGTAAAELLPATIEADYQGLPLLLLTADRPRHYRGSGAPQTIVQPGMFSHYVAQTYDIEGIWNGDLIVEKRPIHLNICFDEPLLDQDINQWTWPHASVAADFASATVPAAQVAIPARRPLVIIGGLPLAQSARVLEIVRAWRRPVYAEATSHLREAFARIEPSLVQYDSVIRIGAVPTLKLWRELETSDVPVWHFSHLPFSGLPRSRAVFPLAALGAFDFEPWDGIASAPPLFTDFPLSEPGWISWLSQQLPTDARLFLGNSLPIREWDLAAARTPREVFANRGANGIDGLISTFLGLCEEGRSNWAVIGDLSALYDLSGPWALKQRPLNDVNLVVINNGGGKIFQRIFNEPLFENRHALAFGDWARMWGWNYICLHKPQPLQRTEQPRLIEIIPDEAQTAAFWSQAPRVR